MPFPRIADRSAAFLIQRSLITHEICHLHLVGILWPILDVRAIHFCYELYNFANSSYDIINYDRNVRYIHQRQYSEFNVK